MLELIIDDISSEDYGLCLMERPIIPTPIRDVEQINVRGRNGSLTRKYGYLDIDIPVRLNLMTDALKGDVRALKPWLLNGTKFQLSDDSVYYVINNVVMGDVENEIAEYGLFDITFNCKPFAYEDISPFTLTASGTVYNPGTEKALPYIKVTGSGAITLDINGRDLSMTLTDYVVIDSELGYAYRGTAGADNLINGELPYLEPGSNVISWTGTVTSVEVKYKAVYV